MKAHKQTSAADTTSALDSGELTLAAGGLDQDTKDAIGTIAGVMPQVTNNGNKNTSTKDSYNDFGNNVNNKGSYRSRDNNGNENNTTDSYNKKNSGNKENSGNDYY
jgi:hypothetical protein